MTPDAKAALILRALSGEHLYGFLPGNDHKQAISHAAGTMHEWVGGDQYGRVTRKGIETYPSLDAMFERAPSAVITWREVLDIVARGCDGGRRAEYEAAFARWNEWARVDGYTVSGKRPSDEEIEAKYERWSKASDGIHAATDAIIRAGCEREPIQPELF
jgi:hypothetical protein